MHYYCPLTCTKNQLDIFIFKYKNAFFDKITKI